MPATAPTRTPDYVRGVAAVLDEVARLWPGTAVADQIRDRMAERGTLEPSGRPDLAHVAGILGEKRGEGFESFEAMMGAAGDLAGVEPRIRMRVRMLQIFSVAAIEAANEASALYPFSQSEIVTDLVEMTATAHVGLMVQAYDAEGWIRVAEIYGDLYARQLRQSAADYQAANLPVSEPA